MEDETRSNESQSQVKWNKRKIPIFITNAVSHTQIRKFFHDLDGSGVHQIQRTAVIRLHEAIAIREPNILSSVWLLRFSLYVADGD